MWSVVVNKYIQLPIFNLRNRQAASNNNGGGLDKIEFDR